MLNRLTYEDFEPHRGKTFTLEGGGGQIEIRLLDVRKSPHAPPRGVHWRHPFAILFAAPPQPDLRYGVFNIRHRDVGLIEGIHISAVPPAPDMLDKANEVRFYEAIFN